MDALLREAIEAVTAPKKRVRTAEQKAKRQEYERNRPPRKKKRVPSPRQYNEPQHGTFSRYQIPKYHCRCDLCRQAASVRHQQQREARYARYKANNYEGVVHGTLYGYNQAGCRCPLCLEATRLYQEQRRRIKRVSIRDN